MKGVPTPKSKIRHMIFTEIARLAYEGGGPEKLEELPYKIIPGEIETYRDSIFVERAIVSERLRVAMGLSLRPISEYKSISDGVDESMIDEKYYEPPLIDIIKFACHKCPEKRVIVTDCCQGCLEHPCQEVCPKGAISMVDGKSYIDQSKCIKCGLCMKACPYNAIIKQERPCVEACGVNAIGKDEYGRADIDQSKCVACGMCLVSCPFAAIVDKGQIYQTIKAITNKENVYAIVAPAIAGQFGPNLTPEKMRGAFQALGFTDVLEVAMGADLCTIEEAQDFLDEVPSKLKFMGTSCCPAWSKMAKQDFPDYADNISMALTPMVLTARLLKQNEPDAKICFIGPCLAKKKEAARNSIKSYVDFTLTFEEVAGMFEAKDVDFDEIPDGFKLVQGSSDGRGFAGSGGVAQAVVNAVKHLDPEREVKVVKAEGLAECKRMMRDATRGKYDGYLLEGMACPGGCIGGAGTLQDTMKSSRALKNNMKDAAFSESIDSVYKNLITDLENFNNDVVDDEQYKMINEKDGEIRPLLP